MNSVSIWWFLIPSNINFFNHRQFQAMQRIPLIVFDFKHPRVFFSINLSYLQKSATHIVIYKAGNVDWTFQEQFHGRRKHSTVIPKRFNQLKNALSVQENLMSLRQLCKTSKLKVKYLYLWHHSSKFSSYIGLLNTFRNRYLYIEKHLKDPAQVEVPHRRQICPDSPRRKISMSRPSQTESTFV